jgi:hypothetical protein
MASRLPAICGAAAWAAAFACGAEGWITPLVAGTLAMAGGFWILDVLGPLRAWSGFRIGRTTTEELVAAENFYYSPALRAPRQRLGLILSGVGPLICLIVRTDVLVGCVLVTWGVVTVSVMLRDVFHAYNEAASILPLVG